MALKSNTIKIAIISTMESFWYLLALKSDLIKSTWTEKPKIWWARQISDSFLGFLCWRHCRNNLQHRDQTGSFSAIQHVDVLKVELLQMLSMLSMLTILISTMNMLTMLATFVDHSSWSHLVDHVDDFDHLDHVDHYVDHVKLVEQYRTQVRSLSTHVSN